MKGYSTKLYSAQYVTEWLGDKNAKGSLFVKKDDFDAILKKNAELVAENHALIAQVEDLESQFESKGFEADEEGNWE